MSETASADVASARSHAIGDLLRRSANRHPDKTALIFGDRSYSYAELDEVVNRTAQALLTEGVQRGERIALFSHNNDSFVVLFFALARIGAISVPVNYMLTAEELGFVLGHSGAVGVIAEDALLELADKALAAHGEDIRLRAVIGTPRAGWQNVQDWMDNADATAPKILVGHDDPIQLMYTSGTESRPKGVTITSYSLIAQYTACAIDGEMTGNDIEVHALPLYHCAQLHCFLVPGLFLGATNVVLPGADAGTIMATVQKYAATKLFCPPTVWISLLRHPDFESFDLSSLAKGYYGASIMPVEVLKELGSRLSNVRLFNFYGQTEMAPLATLLPPGEQIRKAGSAGRAALTVETMVVDDDDNPVPPGEIGEIVHRSPHATLGYWNDPAATAAAFRNGWFHSGDLGVFDDEGFLTVVDRKKDMIKTGGENVASREVEETIYQFQGVAEVAVVGLSHPRWIEAVAAIVVPKAGIELSVDDLRSHCRETLAGFKVPKYFAFAEALPKNPSGKVLKRELRGTYADLSAD